MATINTRTGIQVNGTIYSVFGVFGDTIATNVAATGEKRDFSRAEITDATIASGFFTLVPVCEFCGSPDVKTFNLGPSGELCQCAACSGIWSDDIADDIATAMIGGRRKVSDSIQSFHFNTRGGSRLRGLMTGGVVTQWG